MMFCIVHPYTKGREEGLSIQTSARQNKCKKCGKFTLHPKVDKNFIVCRSIFRNTTFIFHYSYFYLYLCHGTLVLIDSYFDDFANSPR